MTQLLAPRGAEVDTVESTGLVGDRELVCVQTISIGRLRSDPVPITPSCFVAVGGRGPRHDSNGSGKTTFLGAVSLLLGDVGWRPAAGAPEAATLLFDGTKAGVDVERYARADHGYLIGVFARPDGDEPLTVWLRINATAPYLRARAEAGIHLVGRAATAIARNTAADAAWDSMPKPEWGSRSYAAELYGASPRCMAWLQARGNETPGKSLLKLSQETMTPAQIGTALLELLGRDDLLLEDRKARADLDETSRELDRLKTEDEARRREEDVELRAIQGRNTARGHLATAQRLWHLHYARGLVDAVNRLADARAELRSAAAERRTTRRALAQTRARLDALGDGGHLRAGAERADRDEAQARAELSRATERKTRARVAFEQASSRVEELRVAAAASDGTSVEATVTVETKARAALEHATRQAGVADAARRGAADQLAAAERGGGGLAGNTLRRLPAGVRAVALADEIDLDPATRDVWEARLALYADSVVLADYNDLPAAAASAAPGAVLITGPTDDRPMPEGIIAAPPAARAFLTSLAETPTGGPPPTAQPAAHVTVVGGFDHPTTGRAARIEQARRALHEATLAADKAETTQRQAETAVAQAERRRVAAQAAQDLKASLAALDDARRQLADADQAETAEARAHKAALEAKRAVDEASGGYHSERKRLGDAISHDEQALTETTLELRKAIERSRRRRDSIAYWAARWQGDPASATDALAVDSASHPTSSGEDRSSADAYRRAANHALDRALRDCSIDDETGDGAPAGSSIGLAVKACGDRRAPVPGSDEDSFSPVYERQAAAFHELVDALGSWLDRLAVQDDAAAAHITADRARRAQALSAADELCETRRRELPILQDQIERTLRTVLQKVSDQLGQLDLDAGGFGADLKIDVTRPVLARDGWEWRITPRYRRGPNTPLVPYTERANTATEKLLAIHLVLAALFAATEGHGAARGRMLILDELGDSLGDNHRGVVLSGLATTAADAHLTVLGTCQDGVLEDAAGCAGLVLYFQFRDPSDVLNAPTRVFGTSTSGLVELTGPAIERLG
jgi:chromosome segregation protein